MSRPTAPVRRLVALALALLVPGAASAGAGEIPPSLRPLVLHPSHREIAAIELAGARFEAVTTGSPHPFLLWPADDQARASFPREQRAVADWLARCGRTLGHAGFAPELETVRTWRADEVWEYRLVKDGVPLRDAAVSVHWNGRTLVGLVNLLPGEVRSVEPMDAALSPASHVYYPRRGEAGVDLVLARVERIERAGQRELCFVDAQGTLLSRELAGTELPASSGDDHEFREYAVPAGGFPDQISADRSGRIWFSQPNDELIGRFRPGDERFRRFEMPAGTSGPDGLVVDRWDRVWTGLYYQGGLGQLDIATGSFENHAAPYPLPAMAIPMVTREGHVWVTDHQRNRISEFDPATKTWVTSLVLPTPSAWVVAGAEDTLDSAVWFTEWNVNKLAVKRPGQPVQELAAPGSGPSFIAVSGGKVYYSQWNLPRLGAYDTVDGTFTEYLHPVSGETGGPLACTPDGDIVVGTRNRGYILVFDTRTETFASYLIPTPFPGLKDGLTVDRRGVIWFTESEVDKLGRLELR